MIVKELIEWLQKQPQDAIVIYRACSDWQDLDEDELGLIQGEWVEQLHVLDANHRGIELPGGGWKMEPVKHWLVRRPDGHLMVVNERWTPNKTTEEAKQLEPITAVTFPGN